MSMSDAIYWIWLSAAPGITPLRVSELLRGFGSASAVYAAGADELEYVCGSHDWLAALSDKSLGNAEKAFAAALDAGMSVLTRGDSGYPAVLAAISDPPAVLYVRGTLPDFNQAPALAVAGPRKCTERGASAARQFSYWVGKAGHPIVSGLAAGTDAAAHEGALKAGAVTVAVLGCGADICYPVCNTRLYNAIPKCGGAVISEYAPGVSPQKSFFPARNRIISGLSRGLFIPESPARSGSLITAACAAKQKRKVFVMPGAAESFDSVGSNALLKQGATPVTEPGDIISALEKLPPLPNQPKPRAQAKRAAAPARPSGPAAQTLEGRITALLLTKNMTADDIAAELGLDVRQAFSALSSLELDGLIVRAPGNYYAHP